MHTMRVRDVILIATAMVWCLAWWSHEYSLQYKEVFKIAIYNTVDEPLTERRTYLLPKPLLITIPNTYSNSEQEERFLIIASSPDVLEVYDLNLLVSPYLASNPITRNSNTRRATMEKTRPTRQQAIRYRLHFIGTIIATIADIKEIDSTLTTTTITDTISESYVYVLTSDYTLHAYALTPEPILRWQTRVVDRNTENYFHPTHAGLQVMHHGIYQGDHGAIFVAVEVNDGGGNNNDNNVDEISILYAAFHSSDGALRWRVLSNTRNSIQDELHGKGSNDNVNHEFYVDGRENNDFEIDDVLHDVNDNDHEWMSDGKNEKNEMTEREMEISEGFRYAQHWTQFRTEILRTLPHFYTHLWDEHVELQHFAHHANSDHTEEPMNIQWMQSNNVNDNKKDEQMKEIKEENEEILTHSPNVLVYHGAHGIEVLHLYTGYILTKVEPLKPYYVYYQNINADNWIDGLTIKCTWPEKDDERIHYKRIEDLVIQQCMAVGFTGVPDNEVEVMRVSADEPSYSTFSLKNIHKSLSEYQHYLYRSDNKYTNVRAVNPPRIMQWNDKDRAAFVHDRNSFSAQSIITVHTFAKNTQPSWSYRYLHQPNSTESMYDNAVQKWTRELIVVMSESGLLTCVNVADKDVMWQTRTAGPLLQKVIWAWSAQENRKYAPQDPKEEKDINVNKESESFQHSLPYVHLTPFSVLSSDTLQDYVQNSYLQFNTKHLTEKRKETIAAEQKEKVANGKMRDDSYGHSRHYDNVHLFRRERFRYHDYVLAVRDRYLTFVNVHSGNVISSLELSEVPIAPILVADLNRDGISDLLVVTDKHVLGVCGYIEPTSICMRSTMFIALFTLIVLVVMWEYRRQRKSVRDRLHGANNLPKPKRTTSVQHSSLSKQVHEERS